VISLTSTYVDSNGNNLLASNVVRDILSVDLTSPISRFRFPDSTFTGFSYDGNYYSLGVLDTGVDRATWSTEVTSDTRGPQNEFPDTFFVVLTDADVSIIDASDLTLFMRFSAAPYVPNNPEDNPEVVEGVLLEWEADESFAPYLGSAMGMLQSRFLRLGWIDGVLIIVEERGYSVVDFRTDASHKWAFRAGDLSGVHPPRSDMFSGLMYRNMPGYYRLLPLTWSAGFPHPMIPLSIALYRHGGDTYWVAPTHLLDEATEGDVIGATVAVISIGDARSPIAADIPEGRRTDIPTGWVPEVEISHDGVLFILVIPQSGQSLVMRSISEWRTIDFSGAAQVVLPPQAYPFPGEFLDGEQMLPGSMALRGSVLYVGIGSGVWSIDTDSFDLASHLYGNTSTAGAIPPVYDILTTSGSGIRHLKIDPTTGFLCILHGTTLDVVDVDRHKIVETRTASDATDPLLGPDLHRILTFSFVTPTELP
jgi:hypothetical protein